MVGRVMTKGLVLVCLCLAAAAFNPAVRGAQAAQVGLTWAANSESDVTGYRIYFGTASRTYSSSIDVGNRTNYTATGLADGTTYYFAATAYNSSGAESSYSDEASCVTPGGCTYSISPAGQSFTSQGGSGSVNVATQTSCMWSASSGVSWVSLNSAGKTGNGSVSYSVSPNTSGTSRSAGVTIAGRLFTITQTAASSSSTTYTITASAGTGGTISPSGSVAVRQASSKTFYITTGSFRYRISGVLVDGVSVGPVSRYTFTSVNGNHTIRASFARRY